MRVRKSSFASPLKSHTHSPGHPYPVDLEAFFLLAADCVKPRCVLLSLRRLRGANDKGAMALPGRGSVLTDHFIQIADAVAADHGLVGRDHPLRLLRVLAAESAHERDLVGGW